MKFVPCMISVLVLGCCGCNMMAPLVWVAEDQEMQIEMGGVKKLSIDTHNGAIEYSGGGGSAARVKVNKKAGGKDTEDAKEAMTQLEVFVEDGSAGEKKLGHRWKTTKRDTWSARVSFTVEGPASIVLSAESHNGEVTIKGVEGDVRAVSHNGAINSTSSGSNVEATSHNGAVDITCSASKIKATTHNGRVSADLTRCKEIGGTLSSSNGAIVVKVGKETSANMSANTSNGSVSVQGPFQSEESKKNRVRGKLGRGGPSLELTTSNGSISVTE